MGLDRGVEFAKDLKPQPRSSNGKAGKKTHIHPDGFFRVDDINELERSIGSLEG